MRPAALVGTFGAAAANNPPVVVTIKGPVTRTVTVPPGGRFDVRLPPGRYRLVAHSGGHVCPSVVTIRPHQVVMRGFVWPAMSCAGERGGGPSTFWHPGAPGV